jgi:hypothetical protein
MRRASRLPALVALAAAAACTSGKDAGEKVQPVQPMTQAEYERGLEACRAYARRVCACAAARPDAAFGEDCELAPARVEALEALYAANRAEASDRERLITHDKARKVIAACVEGTARLEPGGCPRTAQDPD